MYKDTSRIRFIDSDLIDFQKINSINIPGSYLSYLNANNGRRPLNTLFGPDQDLSYDIVFAFKHPNNNVNLEYQYEQLDNNIYGSDYLPIGRDIFGGTFLLNCNSEDVFHLDRMNGATKLLARGYSEFISQLVPDPSEQNEPIIVSIIRSGDKKRLAEFMESLVDVNELFDYSGEKNIAELCVMLEKFDLLKYVLEDQGLSTRNSLKFVRKNITFGKTNPFLQMEAYLLNRTS